MTLFAPKVSIVIPVYNGANYLAEAVDSALAQTYSNIEVIVINDGSTDNGATRHIALSYGHRIRYFEKENGGVSSALNFGIREMQGDYFSWLSHDDLYLPEKISQQMHIMQDHLENEIVLYGDYEYIDGLGNFKSVKRIGQIGQNKLRYEMIVGDPINGCTVLIPKKCFEKVGIFNENLRTTQDYDMWFRLSLEYRFVHVADILMKSRMHSAQGIKTITNHFNECSKLYARFLHELSVDDIQQFSKEDLSIFYTKTAIKIKVRGYDEAACTALQLAQKYSTDKTIINSIKKIILVFVYILLNKKLKPSFWLQRVRRCKK